MPSNADRYGARISTKVEEAACAYRHAVDCILSAWPGALEALDRATAADIEQARSVLALRQHHRPSRQHELWLAEVRC